MSSKVTFSATMDKIFGTSSSLRVKYRVAGKFGYLYSQSMALALAPNLYLPPALAPNLY